jgi:two-component system, NtrC family, sensor kinase
MKIAAKYTLVLGGTLAIVLAVLGFVRLRYVRVAAAAVEMLTSTARKRHCTIELEAPHPIWLEGSKAELEQVFSNLILNALQAMQRGTVRVRVGVSSRGGHEVAVVEVRDDGAGIAPEHIDRIFDPFFTTKGVGEGTGLGLSVSYGIVRDHAGSIEVASEPGHGARFSVILPLAR